MLPHTRNRVIDNSPAQANRRIQQETKRRVAEVVGRGRAAIDRRLAELDKEWDVERSLETMAPSLTLAGLALGTTVNKRWLFLSGVVQAFFLQHALQGWCPPLPMMRLLGVRTADEINEERYALKALRGDFDAIADDAAVGPEDIEDVWAAVSHT